MIYNILCNLCFCCTTGSGVFSGSGVFTAMQKPLRLWICLSVCCVISRLQSGHLTFSFNLSIFRFFFNYWFNCFNDGPTDSFTILIFGLALGFDFAFALGLISSSLTYSIIASLTSSIIASFTGSSLLIIFSTCSIDSSSDISF